jgi:hypothetical protein
MCLAFIHIQNPTFQCGSFIFHTLDEHVSNFVTKMGSS